MTNTTWAEQYKHPNWQRKRLEAMEGADWLCQNCGAKDVTLNVHHKRYVKGRKIWEYTIEELSVLCEPCHQEEHQQKDLMAALLANVEPGAIRQAIGLIAGYWDANCTVDPDLADLAKEEKQAVLRTGDRRVVFRELRR